MNKKLNFIFWGTPDVASETLEILKENGYIPSLIITSPDKPQGRKMILTPPPAKVWAIKNNIPYIQPENLKELSPTLEIGESIDLFIVVAYGKIIPENIINLPKLGSINIHYSLLPKYRGASPVESAILNGDMETGVTIQQMKYKMDSGPIIAQEKTEINPEEKTPNLRKRLIKIGGELLIKVFPEIIESKIKLIEQDEENATYCKKIKKEDGLIDLKNDGIENYNKFKAYAVWPRTYFFENGKRIIITDAILENNQFIIKKVIPEGKKEVEYKK
jgi:methionyl-tRNA formyltransferase